MGEPADGKAVGSRVVGEAYATARELLERAEEDAARIRADADRYVRQRHQEAELVVAKARRMLAIAEERARAMGAGTVGQPPVAPSTIDLTGGPPAVEAPAQAPAVAAGRRATALDSVLAGAVSRAIERALPSDR